MASNSKPTRFFSRDSKGQVGVTQVLSLVILIFVVFTVGRILFNATSLDPDSTDGVRNLGPSQGGSAAGVLETPNNLTNIGFITMSGIVLIAAMAGIVMRFF